MSAAGGLAGALLNVYADSPILTLVFAVLLIFTGISGLTGLAKRMRFKGWVGWIAGAGCERVTNHQNAATGFHAFYHFSIV